MVDLPAPFGPRQAEDLSRMNLEGKPVESRNLGSSAVSRPWHRRGNKATAGAQRWGGVVDLAQVLSANANCHAEHSPINET